MPVQDYFEPFVMVEKRSVSDGQGGFDVGYVEGAEFMGAVNTDNSIEMRIAEKQGVTSIYTVTTNINVPLQYADIIKSKSSGRYYRITTNPDEMETPMRSQMKFKQSQAETWKMPPQ